MAAETERQSKSREETGELTAAIRAGDFDTVQQCYAELLAANDNKQPQIFKSKMDNALRRAIMSADVENPFNIIDLALRMAKESLTTYSIVVTLMSDLFMSHDVDWCENAFDFFEQNIAVWKSDEFKPARNSLLRLCNDILKRLSRTTDTGFCGRILIFLARCLPLTEKSGLNLISNFNIDNNTRFDSEPDAELKPATATAAAAQTSSTKSEDVDMEEGEMKEIEAAVSALPPMDYTMYCKFWKLQSFLSMPNDCYDKNKWTIFKTYTKEVFALFAGNKLDVQNTRTTRSASASSSKSPKQHGQQAARADDQFFAKYLTSQKLLTLQLNDSLFRRSVLVQFLVIFQYLQADTKFKDVSKVLTEEQNKWVNEMTAKCYRLLEETSPNGAHFAKSIKHILDRETHWSDWKNNGCADFTKNQIDKDDLKLVRKRVRKTYNESEPADMGNAELTRLWNLKDNMEACKDPDRKFISSLETFLAKPLDELNPDSVLKEADKSFANDNFQWRAFRMQMQHAVSMEYSMGANKVPASMNFKSYIEKWIRTQSNKIPGLKPVLVQHDKRAKELEVEKEEAAKKAEEEKAKELVEAQTAKPEKDSTEEYANPPLTDEHIDALSVLIDERWIAVAKHLNWSKDSIEAHKKKGNKPSDVCKMLLNQWVEQEGTAATSKLRNTLLEANVYDEKIAAALLIKPEPVTDEANKPEATSSTTSNPAPVATTSTTDEVEEGEVKEGESETSTDARTPSPAKKKTKSEKSSKRSASKETGGSSKKAKKSSS